MPRLTLRGLLLFMLVAGLVLAAVARPTPLAASLLFLGAVAVLLGAVAAAIYAGGRARAAAGGASIFGWAYLVMAFGPFAWLNNEGLRPPTLAPIRLYRVIYPDVDSSGPSHRVDMRWVSGGGDDARPGDGSALSTEIRAFPSRAHGYSIRIASADQVLHTLSALVFAAIGAAIAFRVAPRVRLAHSTD